MISGSTDYRWYSLRPGGKQEDGFFVDSLGRILYWPAKKAPGYVVNVETAESIRAIRAGGEKAFIAVAGFAMVLAAFVLKLIYNDPGLHLDGPIMLQYFRFLTGTVSIVPAITTTLCFLSATIYIPHRSLRGRRIAPFLRRCAMVDMPRPVAQFLKPSQIRLRRIEWSKTTIVLIGIPVIIIILMGMAQGLFSPLPGDPIFTIAAGLGMIWLCLRVIRRERLGLRKDQVNLFNGQYPDVSEDELLLTAVYEMVEPTAAISRILDRKAGHLTSTSLHPIWVFLVLIILAPMLFKIIYITKDSYGGKSIATAFHDLVSLHLPTSAHNQQTTMTDPAAISKVTGAGLQFRDYSSTRQIQDGVEIFVLQGLIANNTNQTHEIPLLHLSLYDDKVMIQQLVVNPPQTTLASRTTVAFRIALPRPNPRATRFEVTFMPKRKPAPASSK